jgi:hypothetical protein
MKRNLTTGRPQAADTKYQSVRVLTKVDRPSHESDRSAAVLSVLGPKGIAATLAFYAKMDGDHTFNLWQTHLAEAKPR